MNNNYCDGNGLCLKGQALSSPTPGDERDGMLECIRELDAVLFMSMELGGSIFWGTEANKNRRAALRGFERRRTKARTLAAKFLKRGEG